MKPRGKIKPKLILKLLTESEKENPVAATLLCPQANSGQSGKSFPIQLSFTFRCIIGSDYERKSPRRKMLYSQELQMHSYWIHLTEYPKRWAIGFHFLILEVPRASLICLWTPAKTDIYTVWGERLTSCKLQLLL